MVISNKDKYNIKFKFPKGTAHSKKDISKTTGIPVKILDEVWDRGMGAWKSNPQSVRNVKGVKGGAGKKMSQQAWSYGRIYSFVMKGPTWKTADADLAKKVKALKIKGYMR
jgi:hypothetical protein